jgi:hypothetical protein
LAGYSSAACFAAGAHRGRLERVAARRRAARPVRRKVLKAGDCFHLRVGTRAQTLLVVACLADEASTFERLQAAGKLARSALEGEPSRCSVAAGL